MNRRVMAAVGLALTVVVAGVVFMALRAPDQADAPVGEAGGGAEPLNILIITLDDWGVDKLDGYADDAYAEYRDEAMALPETPNINMLAEVGARFTDAWANPSCSPTRAAMQTGMHGHRTEIGMPIGYAGVPDLDPSLTSLADLARSAGYRSALIGKWHLGEGLIPDRWESDDLWEDHLNEQYELLSAPAELGYDAFYGSLHGELDVDGRVGYYGWTRIIGRSQAGVETMIALTETDWAPDQNVEDALTWISYQSGPWLAMVNFNTPHTPLQDPPAGCHHRDEEGWEPADILETYQAMVECTDLAVAELLDGIDDLDDTIIFLMGDNGTAPSIAEGLFADGRGKNTLYESGIRVPLLVADGRKWMARQEGFTVSADWRQSTTLVEFSGKQIADPVHAVDFYATVAELLGVDASQGVDSVSMLPLITGGEGEVRTAVYAEQFADYGGTAAYRVGDTKLMVEVDGSGSEACRSGYELYDLLGDRFEDSSLVESDPEQLADLLARFDAYVADNGIDWVDVPDCTS